MTMFHVPDHNHSSYQSLNICVKSKLKCCEQTLLFFDLINNLYLFSYSKNEGTGPNRTTGNLF